MGTGGTANLGTASGGLIMTLGNSNTMDFGGSFWDAQNDCTFSDILGSNGTANAAYTTTGATQLGSQWTPFGAGGVIDRRAIGQRQAGRRRGQVHGVERTLRFFAGQADT
jgi:hypothetical protein